MYKNVILADDSMFMRNLVKKILSNTKYKVVSEAPNGCVAVENYKIFSPDILLLDLTMPCKEGITVIKEIIEYDPTAKIIVLSAMGQQRLIIDALNLGAKDFIVKPNFNMIIPTLNKIS